MAEQPAWNYLLALHQEVREIYTNQIHLTVIFTIFVTMALHNLNTALLGFILVRLWTSVLTLSSQVVYISR